MCRMSEFVVHDAIVPDLQATTKEGSPPRVVPRCNAGRGSLAIVRRTTSYRRSCVASSSDRPVSAAILRFPMRSMLARR